MKKYIRSDESDYIRIGNRIIPKDASNLGDASYDRVSEVGRRNYEAEVAERKAAEERARIAELGQGKHDLAFSEVDEAASVEDQLQSLFEALVPNEGQCDNLGGELVRAMMRIMYRDLLLSTGWHYLRSAPHATASAQSITMPQKNYLAG